MADRFKTGELLINIHATGAALKVLVKVLEQINQDMISIASEKGRFSEIAMKKFVVSYSSIRFVDQIMFAAFVSPKDDIFYQEETSGDWEILNSIMKYVPL